MANGFTEEFAVAGKSLHPRYPILNKDLFHMNNVHSGNERKPYCQSMIFLSYTNFSLHDQPVGVIFPPILNNMGISANKIIPTARVDITNSCHMMNFFKSI